jgi:hypothetical protein
MKRWFVLILIHLAALIALGRDASAQKAPVYESPHKELTLSCEECHVATSFKDIRYEHDRTDFRLDGAHSRVPCLACHNIENFSKVERWCVTCHEDIPRGRMGVDCARCHSANGWTVFDAEGIHQNTDFPIQGRHLLIDCLSCHPSMPTADFRRHWTPCYDCHRQEYELTVDPNHRASGFSTLCQTCHEMTGWRPSIMADHDMFFPIYSGTHNRQWDACSDCHVVPGNYQAFECITCHEHGQAVTDSPHQGIPSYAYTSQACYDCHPTGRAGDFTEHDPAFFPIFSGVHNGTWDNCATCHPTPENKKIFTCVSCHEHDQASMDSVHRGEAQNYVYSATSCYECHPTGRAED